MEKIFTGKVALVTGGTSGIGRATAIAFAEQGAKVVLTGRREDKGRETVDLIEKAGGEGRFFQADVASEESCKNMVENAVDHFGRLDFAFNNAGIEGTFAPVTEVKGEDYERVMNINVLGVLNSMKYEIPAMLKSGGGSIINTSSVFGMVGSPGGSVYCASKHAVIGLTKVAALEWGQKGIRVNAVSPAAIETEMFDRFTGGNPEAAKTFAEAHPIGRVGKSDEIANPVTFLCTDGAAFITGANLPIDGALTAR